MPWLLNEDAAIKAKFKGLTVTDSDSPNGRSVAVRFRLPETELAKVTFPQIIIDPAQIIPAPDREFRGPTYLPYVPEEYEGDPGVVNSYDRETGFPIEFDPREDVTRSPFLTNEHPVPFNFDYQITVETRKQSHLTQLIGALAQRDRIPYRFGYLEVGADRTIRTLDLLAGPEPVPAKDSDGKRLFRVMYRVRVVSELAPYEIANLAANVRVTDLALDLELITELGTFPAS